MTAQRVKRLLWVAAASGAMCMAVGFHAAAHMRPWWALLFGALLGAEAGLIAWGITILAETRREP